MPSWMSSAFFQFITVELGLFTRFMLADFCSGSVHHLLTAKAITAFSSQLLGSREAQI